MRLFIPIHIIMLCTVLRSSTSFLGFNRFRRLMNTTNHPSQNTNTSELNHVEEILHRSYVHM
jgi:hypothetical protein